MEDTKSKTAVPQSAKLFEVGVFGEAGRLEEENG